MLMELDLYNKNQLSIL